jgi:23S rRNA (cytosine1962-C5)-methyltransferase
VSLASLWPSFPLDRILFEDADLVVIDKPVGVSTHAADERGDDAITRLRLALAERDGVAPERVYLGTHQRLDRDTSGVLLFTRRKSANRAVAAEFESRRTKKTYVAAVGGWPAKLEHGVMRHHLAPEKGGRMAVARAGQEAVTRYRVIRRSGDRALLDLQPETGRTHQIRVQVAAMGAGVAGDRLYGAVPAPRLLLHAASISIRHPSTENVLTVEAPPPRELDDWVAGHTHDAFGDPDELERRLRAAIDARWALGRSQDLDAFRLVHGEGDDLAGMAVDIYGDHLLVHLFTPEATARKEQILDLLQSFGARGVYVKTHPKRADNIVDPRSTDLCPSHAVRGEDAADPLPVREDGSVYRVRLGDGLKTGIFLDQRDNRRRVREMSSGLRVLNLFAYTCAFTVAAAKGGAKATVSVDVSAAALARGADNLAENGFGGNADHEIACEDVFDWMRLAARRGERFDLVILDPPSYATTHKSRFVAESDYPDLAKQALELMTPNGRMLACTNHKGISPNKFRRHIFEAGRLSGRSIQQIKDLPPPVDFPVAYGADPDTKCVLVTLGAAPTRRP